MFEPMGWLRFWKPPLRNRSVLVVALGLAAVCRCPIRRLGGCLSYHDWLGKESSSTDVAASTGLWRRHTGPQEDLSGHGNWITFGFGLQLVARRSSTLITHCVYVEITK